MDLAHCLLHIAVIRLLYNFPGFFFTNFTSVSMQLCYAQVKLANEFQPRFKFFGRRQHVFKS